MADVDAGAPGTMELPWRRNPAELRAGLEAWFRAVPGGGGEATIVDLCAPEGSGMSSETVLVDVDRGAGGIERYVVRLAPSPDSYPVFPSYDLELQARCLRTVAEHTDVPVPSPRWYEADGGWLGAPFLVTDRADGVAPADTPPYVFGGWLAEAGPGDRSRLQREALGVLARLHALRPDRVDLSFLEHPGSASPLDRHLDQQRAYYQWAREGVTYPLVERTFAWLDDHRPDGESPPVLLWGDARIGNMLFRDFRPTAVLDWEMAGIGPAEVDVAWMIFTHHFFQHLAVRFGLPGMPEFMARDDVARDYEAMTGTRLGDLRWYEMYAGLRLSIVFLRTSMRSIVYGQAERPDDPDDLVLFRDVIESMLAGTFWG